MVELLAVLATCCGGEAGVMLWCSKRKTEEDALSFFFSVGTDTWHMLDPGDRMAQSPGGRSALPFFYKEFNISEALKLLGHLW
jgi:hypothetical protein